MIGLNRLRSWLDSDEPERQRVRPDEVDAPHDVQDPTTFPDEATLTFGERIKQNKTRFLTHSFLILAGTAVTAIMLNRFAPGIYTSWWTTRALPAVLIAAGIFAAGAKWLLGRLPNHDWLVLRYPLTIKLYLGEFVTTDDGNRAFKPYRGFSLLGGKSHPYELGEVSEELSQSAAKRGRSAQDPVMMELPSDEKAAPIIDTWLGSIGHVVTDGVVPNRTHSELDFMITSSANDHDTIVDSLIDRLRTKSRRIKTLEDELENVREERDKYREKAKETRDEARKEFKDDMTDVMIAQRNPTQARQDNTDSGVSPETNGHDKDGYVPTALEDDHA